MEEVHSESEFSKKFSFHYYIVDEKFQSEKIHIQYYLNFPAPFSAECPQLWDKCVGISKEILSFSTLFLLIHSILGIIWQYFGTILGIWQKAFFQSEGNKNRLLDFSHLIWESTFFLFFHSTTAIKVVQKVTFYIVSIGQYWCNYILKNRAMLWLNEVHACNRISFFAL